MKWLRWMLMLVSLFFLTTCGSDDGMDQNTNDPDNTTEQTNNPDADEDGVSDDDDLCPDTPSEEQADETGCSPSQLDSDNDGVNDATDECPDTPEGEDVDEQGCSDSQKDSDGDGVNDAEDQCPDTPADAEVNEAGCVEEARTYVPDDGFEQTLIDLGYDDVLDDYVFTVNIASIDSLSLSGNFTAYLPPEAFEYEIEDLTGIEDFVSLEVLTLRNMDLQELALSSLSQLKTLTMSVVHVENEYNISGFDQLGYLHFESPEEEPNTSLPEVISDNPGLIEIYGHYGNVNQWSRKLVIENNSNLNSIYFAFTRVYDLSLVNNPELESVIFGTCGFNSFYMENVPAVKELHASGEAGAFENIDLSGLPLLEKAYLVWQDLIVLDVSKNPLLKELNVQYNDDLSCIQVNQDQLDNIPEGWVKDEEAEYKLDCN